MYLYLNFCDHGESTIISEKTENKIYVVSVYASGQFGSVAGGRRDPLINIDVVRDPHRHIWS
jgi:hypothetical protein